MLEERERTYKQGLVDRFEDRIPSGEEVGAVAICQVGAPPWAQVVPILAGMVLVAVSLFGAGLPIWVGALGAALVLGGGAMTFAIKRRLLARTNRAVHVFALPRSANAGFEPAVARFELADLPGYESGAAELGGERYWPNYGSGNERDAMVEALAPARTSEE